MRVMVNDATPALRISVVKHIVLNNNYAYYLTAQNIQDMPYTAYGVADKGYSTLGYFDADELSYEAVSETTNLMNVLPAIGWHWE